MFCPKCGTQVSENDHYCPTCGEVLSAKAKEPDLGDRTAIFEQEDIERTHVLAALCYVSFVLMVVALLLEPNSKFLRYHINQSILISVFGIVICIVAIVPFIGWLASAVGAVMAVVFTIMGIVRSLKGQAKDLPIIGKYVIVNYN